MVTDAIMEKIITAAVECVEEYGLTGATNRRISEKAGVNLAAINYYFRSKDNLIEKVMETTLENAFDWEDFEKLPGRTAKEHCVAIFEDLISGGVNYPGITRAHFYDLITNGNYSSLVVKRYTAFLLKLCEDLTNRGINMRQERLSMACSQIAYACFMAILTPRLNVDSVGINIEDPETRHRFVSDLIDKLL